MSSTASFQLLFLYPALTLSHQVCHSDVVTSLGRMFGFLRISYPGKRNPVIGARTTVILSNGAGKIRRLIFTLGFIKCDLCHSRKVKCDRLDPCMNCVDARAECRRSRPRRSMRPRVSRIAGLSERLSTLEQFISYPPSAVPASTQDPGQTSRDEDVNHSKIDPNTSSHPPSSGSWNARPSEGNVAPHRVMESPTGAENLPIHQVCEAQRFIQQELQHNNHLSLNRRTVLENALLLVNKISNSSSDSRLFSGNTKHAEDGESDLEEFSLETYLMMSINLPHPPSPQNRFHWPDHVSVKGLEHMSLSLAEGKLDRQTALHYRVCVYSKALFFLARVPQKHLSPWLRTHIKRTQDRYVMVAAKALDQINFVGTHSISLVQALLSGALLHQMQGNQTRGWTLTAFASQLLVSMNYHTITENTPARSQEEEDARQCLMSCFYLDKMLSMLLLRPPSLPRLKINPSLLVPLDDGVPLSMIFKTMIELAQVQEAAMELICGRHGLSDRNDFATRLGAIIQDLVSLRSAIDERCANSRHVSQVEWIATEFRYYATMTTILHCSSKIQERPQGREECLVNARQALQALGRVQKILNDEDTFAGAYPMFLSWHDLTKSFTGTVLFYPMTPFYLLFCNVVGTSSLEDFQLMRDTAKGLYQFIECNPAVAKLYHLFTTFLTLCSPLVQQEADSISPLYMAPDLTTVSELQPNVALEGMPVDTNMYDGPARLGVVGDRVIDPMNSWNNAQMWELFGMQPSLEWVDSGNPNVNPEDYQ
ncbi:hypothetical protein BO78DRAFT_442994 [Aspergillus sclerotiicarbonarius CBS 121057]|uniref:Zn(2)-C6 fungal-type domain-containing protein n=1 Tax=Aspergillus sclerotiicarbonarius (strain CBS 121057 / IBT 28362) TaxID=1448318 RepID=A0A319EZ17_ASPSB|nr:hypothetical protein BO78DRAFT_442994 [Aspergillus sclerotiicarbonarius CBS 121057]